MSAAFELHIVFDCADPDRVTRFWMAALGGYDFPFGVPEGFATWDEFADANGIPVEQRNVGRTLVDQDRDRPDIFFLKVLEAKAGKNRLHLDIKVAPGLDGDTRRTRIDAEADRLIALGATVTERFDTPEDIHLILQDPEGNEFCLA
ncbi:MAG: hypothetical protein QOG10_3899 [Kribbellaceae bacterium]|nr:hypothetical protein [Kribbellaceae bacterium]